MREKEKRFTERVDQGTTKKEKNNSQYEKTYNHHNKKATITIDAAHT